MKKLVLLFCMVCSAFAASKDIKLEQDLFLLKLETEQKQYELKVQSEIQQMFLCKKSCLN